MLRNEVTIVGIANMLHEECSVFVCCSTSSHFLRLTGGCGVRDGPLEGQLAECGLEWDTATTGGAPLKDGHCSQAVPTRTGLWCAHA